MTRDELDPDEHAAFVAAVVACFAEHSAPATVRALLDDPRGESAALRDRAVRELGLPGLAVDEELGGAGASLHLVADVVFEGGRRLVGGSLLATALATVVVDRLDGSAALLSGIAAGELTAALALHDRADDPVRVAGDPATTTNDASGHAASDGTPTIRLSGTRTTVLDGLHTHRLVVPVAIGDDWLVAMVDGDAAGVERQPRPPLDLTRRIADVTFRDTPATVLGGGAIADETWQRALDAATVLIAADAVGAAAESVDRAVAYARERHQFGRPIGGFQAVKHLLAEAHVDVESARGAIEHAAARADGPDAAEACALAGLHALRVAAEATRTAIQVHGGIGFTWEHDAQLFHRRALAASGLLRPVAALERRLVAAACAAAT